MSAAQSSAPAAAASVRAPFQKRPRHFWEGPDPTDEPDEENQGAAHVSPVARLYRHALESVLGFLKLADLSLAASVSRSWSAAVRSMASINAAVKDPRHPYLIAASPLAYHVSEFSVQYGESLPLNDLFILSRPPLSLRSLTCTVDLSPSSRLFFGASLKSLKLILHGQKIALSAINDAIATISRLPSLEGLTLSLPEFFPELSFEPLAAAKQLQDLEVSTRELFPKPTLRHLDQFRMLPWLRKMTVHELRNDGLAYLLRPPHSLQWQQIHLFNYGGSDEIPDSEPALLSALPRLTALSAFDCCSVAFLPVLPRLRTLMLCMDDTVRLAADITAGLSGCSQLTDLCLRSEDVTSKHLSQALSHLPLLQILKLSRCSALDSLSFLSECPHLAQSLESLIFRGCDPPVVSSTELAHVLTLKSLTSLQLYRVFVEPLDSLMQHLLTPPSVVLPKLKRFEYRGPEV